MLSDTGLSNKIKIDMNRGRHFQVLAMFVCCCYLLPSRTTPTAQKLEVFISGTVSPTPKFKHDIGVVLDTMGDFAGQDHLSMGFTRIAERVAPVEFVFIGVFPQRLVRSAIAHTCLTFRCATIRIARLRRRRESASDIRDAGGGAKGISGQHQDEQSPCRVLLELHR